MYNFEFNRLQVIGNALPIYIKDSKIIFSISGLISNLAKNNKQNKIILRKSGVCENLILLLKSDENTVLVVCEALKHLTQDDEINSELLHQFDTCELLILILETHSYKSDVIAVVLDAIRVLALGSTGNKQRMGTILICKSITDFLREHINNNTVIELGCAALEPLLIGLAENSYFRKISYITLET